MNRTALFDVDGTLVDSNDLHAEAWRIAFAHFGHDLPRAAIRSQIGKGGDNLIPALLPGLTDAQRDEIDEWRGVLFKRDFLFRVTPFPGVRSLFERLAGDGWRIVLASSGSAEEVAFHLGLTGAADLVYATTSRDDAAHSKPCADIFAAALDKAGAEAADAIVVGDTPYDMAAAGKIGLRAIGLLCGGFSDQDLGGAIARYRDPAHLLTCYNETAFAGAEVT